MKLLFIDTEFNGFGGELISLALTDGGDEEWYGVVGCANPTPWVAEHVMPILDKSPEPVAELRRSLSIFLEKFEEVTIVADHPADIALFCDFVIVNDQGDWLKIPPPTFQVKRIRYTSRVPHNALEDARAIARAYRLALEQDAFSADLRLEVGPSISQPGRLVTQGGAQASLRQEGA